MNILPEFRRRILDGSADLSMGAAEGDLDCNSGSDHRDPERYVHRSFTSFGLAIHHLSQGLDLRPTLDFFYFAMQFVCFDLYLARANVVAFVMCFS
ncbi:MAG: hypothetical protein ACJ8AH_13845 [Stellaceae bacterium]